MRQVDIGLSEMSRKKASKAMNGPLWWYGLYYLIEKLKLAAIYFPKSNLVLWPFRESAMGPEKMHFLAQNCNFGAKSRSTSSRAEVGQENEPLEAFLSFLLKKAFLEFCKFFRAKPFGWLQKEPKNATFIAFFKDRLVISIRKNFHSCITYLLK